MEKYILNYQVLSEEFIIKQLEIKNDKIMIKSLLNNNKIDQNILLDMYKGNDEQEGYLLNEFNNEFIEFINELKKDDINVKENTNKYKDYNYNKLKRKQLLIKSNIKAKLKKIESVKDETKRKLKEKKVREKKKEKQLKRLKRLKQNKNELFNDEFIF